MESPTSRRRPGPPPAGAPPGGPGRTPPDPFRVIAVVGALALVAVLVIAVATDTVDDVPWGAVIGVAVIVVAAVVTSRRRARRIRESFPDEDE